MIERCWSQDPKDRPTFDEILFELKNNHEFITENVIEVEFLNYVRFIDEYKITFDTNKELGINELSKINYKSNKLIKNILNIKVHFPFKYFIQLNEENQKLVMEAEKGDSEKQFIVAKNLQRIIDLLYKNDNKR